MEKDCGNCRDFKYSSETGYLCAIINPSHKRTAGQYDGGLAHVLKVVS